MMSIRVPVALVAALAGALGCSGESAPADIPTCDRSAAQRLPIPAAHCEAGAPPTGYPTLVEPCDFGPASPSRLLVSTTDFSTGALSLVDLANAAVTPDVALGSTDGIPMAHDGLAYIIHRYGFDYIDALDPSDGYRSVREFPVVTDDGRGLNPYDLDFRSDGLAFVTAFDSAGLEVLDLTCDPTLRTVGTVDLSAWADADGKPEQIFSITCGDTLFVAAQRLDSTTYAPVDTDILIPVDMNSCHAYDLEPTTAAAEAITLGGGGPKQFRRDPTDPDGHTALVLTAGIERVDLATGAVSWATVPEIFSDLGLGPWNLLDFDADADGTTAYVAAWTPDFSGMNVWKVTLDSLESPTVIIEGLFGAEKTLHLVGDTLWIGDTSIGSAGMKAFDLTTTPATLITTLDTGLPPYRAVAVP